MRTALLALAAVALAAPMSAQEPPTNQSRADRFMRYCEDWDDRRSRARERFCEVRDTRLSAPATTLLVDGRDNGGVTIYGWDRNEVLVRALISANSDTRGEAQALAKDIKIETDGHRIRADGPRTQSRYEYWSVSYEVWVPKKTNLDAEAHNGGVSVEGVEGRMQLHTVNGGVHLRDVAGDVRAETTNGGATAYLTGSTWRGTGLDLQTTNGGVTLDIPRNYNADLETGTVNGGFEIEFPVTVQGFVGRRITSKLGNGGPRIRAYTTNGGVRIRSN
jgi:hypothetical protein